MNDHEPRLWPHSDAIRSTGERFLARTLPKSAWTHESHLSTCAWLILERPDIAPERDLPDLIRGYNESVGGVNDATQGYHETITQIFIRAVRAHIATTEAGKLRERVNALLLSPQGRRDWPLRFYSKERLFSAEARLGWVEPDL
jgi:hypothetical protein